MCDVSENGLENRYTSQTPVSYEKEMWLSLVTFHLMWQKELWFNISVQDDNVVDKDAHDINYYMGQHALFDLKQVLSAFLRPFSLFLNMTFNAFQKFRLNDSRYTYYTCSKQHLHKQLLSKQSCRFVRQIGTFFSAQFNQNFGKGDYLKFRFGRFLEFTSFCTKL